MSFFFNKDSGFRF